jgi:hypothetical protein
MVSDRSVALISASAEVTVSFGIAMIAPQPGALQVTPTEETTPGEAAMQVAVAMEAA